MTQAPHILEEPVLPGRCGALMRGGGELVLLLAGKGVGVLGQRTHRLIGEDVVEPVVGEVVSQCHVAVFVSGAGLFEHVRRLCHRFLTAGHHHVEVPRPDQLICQCDGVQAGPADRVDG